MSGETYFDALLNFRDDSKTETSHLQRERVGVRERVKLLALERENFKGTKESEK